MNKRWHKSSKDKVQDDQGQGSRKERESGRLCNCCGVKKLITIHECVRR
jgi:hypothetical protein